MHDDLLSSQSFAALSREVQKIVSKYKWFGQHGFEFIMLILRVGVYAGGLYMMSFPHVSAKIIGLAVVAYGFYGIGITGTHESRHNGFVASARGNKLWGYVFGDFWSGESSDWWYSHHVQDHHVYTNIYGKDENYFVFPWINRYVYLLLAPYLVVPALLLGSLKFLWKKWWGLTQFIILFLAGFGLQAYFFHLTGASLGWSITLTVIMRSFYSPVFMHLALFNHIGLEKLLEKIPWLPHQTKTTRNLKPNIFLLGLGGNAFVNRHIEHHLFPSLSNRMLNKISPVVRHFLKKEGYEYFENTYDQCLKACVKHYDTLFVKGPPPLSFK